MQRTGHPGRRVRSLARLSVLVATVVLSWTVLAASAAVAAELPATGSIRAAAPIDGGADADSDGYSDAAEVRVCGGVTCADGTEDRDADGVADVVEAVADCPDQGVTCVDPSLDATSDGVPDFVAAALCRGDVAGCPAVWADEDGDGYPNWVEYVITGTVTFADGSEDVDGSGFPDVQELVLSLAAPAQQSVPGRELPSGGFYPDEPVDPVTGQVAALSDGVDPRFVGDWFGYVFDFDSSDGTEPSVRVAGPVLWLLAVATLLSVLLLAAVGSWLVLAWRRRRDGRGPDAEAESVGAESAEAGGAGDGASPDGDLLEWDDLVAAASDGGGVAVDRSVR